MTKQELSRAFKIAEAGNGDSSALNQGIFSGFGLPDFEKVTVTVEAVASLIGWQCGRFDGTWDFEALTEIEHFGRNKFLIVN